MRRIALTLLILALTVRPVLPEGVQKPAKTGAPGTNVEMPFLIAPMSKDGKLLGYAYISSKMVATSQSAAIGIREKLAFIQDAFVRDVNTQPIGMSDDPKQVDVSLLNGRLVADAVRIVGSDKVVSMVFTEVKFAPLHPGESTLNLVPPSERAPGAAEPQPAPQPNQSAGSPAATAPQVPSPATSKPAKDSTH